VAHLLAHLFADVTPVRVAGDVEYLINRTENGWVVTLFNDHGVFKPQQGMAQVDRSAIVTATLSLKNQKLSTASEWTSDTQLAVQHGVKVQVTIPPGGIAIVELK